MKWVNVLILFHQFIDNLSSILFNLKAKLAKINITKIELDRLVALLGKVIFAVEEGKSALQMYEEALGISKKACKIGTPIWICKYTWTYLLS